MEVTASVEIDRAPAEVFAYLADVSSNPAWQKGLQRCTWTSEPPLGPGSSYDQVATYFGRTVTSSWVVTDFEPGSHIRVETIGGTRPVEVTRQVAPAIGRADNGRADNGRADNGRADTVVSTLVRGEPGGVFGFPVRDGGGHTSAAGGSFGGPRSNIAVPLLRIIARNTIRSDHQRLKAILEAV